MVMAAGVAGAADTKSEHGAKTMSVQECRDFMAMAAKPGAPTDAAAKQKEAQCAATLQKADAKQDAAMDKNTGQPTMKK